MLRITKTWHTDMKRAAGVGKCCRKNWSTWCIVATNLQFVKSTLSVKRVRGKCDKAKCNGMKSACT